MKIKTDTPDLLIVDDTPWLTGVMLIVFILVFVGVGLGLILEGIWHGLIFLVVGGGMGAVAFVLFVRRVQVVFYRPEGWVEIRRANALRHSRVRHTIDEISRAVVEQSAGKNGTLYRVVLEIDHGQSAGRHPLSLAYSNIGDHRGVAHAINDWLAG
ncbi:hypothetical protein FLO80_06405 [Aquicoccus porphyridii]|uniref:DUF2244 domain-containing protein n=1 Tax=Aquicoccus porphyridii TaxID=1852029 RepID=A0A5A9ZKF4_9RHOB|nr:hypothetical protein [Aquicoccus porphyridii]KAA0917660.1 hypothetical protein FLO80_06405 [Aquicoccus porphyridii]RAI55733.1 hypothetical protein DOO74_04930 [Rhodobacteraceae bacterium AsT-22]